MVSKDLLDRFRHSLAYTCFYILGCGKAHEYLNKLVPN
jgi:hypothetical protein